jgi:hypothetical protein
MRDVDPRVRQCGTSPEIVLCRNLPMVRDTRPDGDVVSLRTKSTHRIPFLVDKVTSDLVRFDTTTGGDSTRDLN